MTQDTQAELKRLKRDFLEMERANREEKEALIRIIHTLSATLTTDPEVTALCEPVKGLLAPDRPLPLELLETEMRKLKDGILAREQKSGAGLKEQVEKLRERLIECGRTLSRIMLPVLEDFYPFTGEVAAQASAVKVSLKEEGADMAPAAAAFTLFIRSLKAKIQADFRYVQSNFLSLLNHVKELEQALSREFGGEESLQKVGYFEMRVNEEIGSIVQSFNLYTTVSEIRSAVIDRIENIKRIVARRKEEDTRRLLLAQESIHKLKQRIADAEKEALELARRAQEFQTLAMKDGLTGLYNRKAFDVKVKEVLQRGPVAEGQVCLILFDVNDFKGINDTFGHVAGDKVLQKVAQCLQETFRKGDFIARYGGDEFAVLIEGMSEEMGRERIQGFHRSLRKRRFTSYKKGDITVNVSAGIAPAVDRDTVETLLDRADKAMYAAKPRKP
jgi:diguanylate cyclase (GGDEF)-like protein